MSVDIKLKLPAGTHVNEVAQAAARLLGNELQMVLVDKNKWLNAVGVKTRPGWSAETCYIIINLNDQSAAAKAVSGSVTIFYSFESESHDGPLLILDSTATKAALCVGLAKVFGGDMDVNDSDNEDLDFHRPATPLLELHGDERFDAFQRILQAIVPIQEEDIVLWKGVAAH